MTQELSIKDEIRLYEKKKLKSAWANPAKTWELSDDGQLVRPNTIFFGERAVGGEVGFAPTWEEPCFDMSLAKEGWAQIKSGSTTDRAKVTVDPYIGAWKNIAHEYDNLISEAIKSGSRSALKSAGIGLSSDFSSIDVINVANQMLNTELRDFSLENAVTEIAVPQLTISIDTYTRFTAQKSIGEGVPPILKLGAIARSTYDLPKDGGGVALSFEAQTRASHDLMRVHIENLVSDLRRIKSNKIATEIETAVDVSAGDWAGITSDHFTRVALDDIGTVCDTIVSNNGRPDTIALHDRPARDLITNMGAVLFQGQTVAVNTLGGTSTARSFGIPGTNITAYVDNEKTATIASVYDKRAIAKFQGPVRTAVVSMGMEDVDAFRVFDFNLPKLLIAGRARDLTSVSA